MDPDLPQGVRACLGLVPAAVGFANGEPFQVGGGLEDYTLDQQAASWGGVDDDVVPPVRACLPCGGLDGLALDLFEDLGGGQYLVVALVAVGAEHGCLPTG